MLSGGDGSGADRIAGVDLTALRERLQQVYGDDASASAVAADGTSPASAIILDLPFETDDRSDR